MKLLFYNWADCFSTEGGGVTVYLRSLLTAEALRGHQVTMLSSGSAYTLSGKEFWRHVSDGNDARAPWLSRYEVVNSHLLAPSICAFASPHERTSPRDAEVFMDFMEKTGPYDCVHFHNLEGLSLEAVQRLRSAFPQTKLVFSLHNYFPFCPQVNLYRPKENDSCNDFCNGKKCLDECSKYAANIALWQKLMKMMKGSIDIRKYKLYWMLKMPVLALLRVCAPAVRVHEEYFVERRKAYVDTLNTCFDSILCVSERVREIARGFGVREELLGTDYIGTSMSDTYRRAKFPQKLPERGIVLTYLGYANFDKGFFFLLNALEKLPPEVCKNVNVQLAARGCVGKVAQRARKKLRNFGRVLLSNGYRRDDLHTLLARTDIGLVPQIWEDCLPQTALEMHCHGIPLFCSDRGGAKELAGCRDFVFRAGDDKDFVEKLARILRGETPLAHYWDKAKTPQSIDEHVKTLVQRYEAMHEDARAWESSDGQMGVSPGGQA